MSLATVIGTTCVLAGLLCLGHPSTLAGAWSGLLVLLTGLLLMTLCRGTPCAVCSNQSHAATVRSEEDPGGDPNRRASRLGTPARLEDADTRTLTHSFIEWFDRHEFVNEIWPAFDRWLRDSLGGMAAVRRVRSWRVLEGTPAAVHRGWGPQSGWRLQSLAHPLDEHPWIGSVPEFVHHVIGSGRPYIRGADNDPEISLAIEMAGRPTESAGPGSAEVKPAMTIPDVLLPVTENGGTVGLISMGEVDEQLLRDVPRLGALCNLLVVCWRHVEMSDALATARRTDRASGVLNRLDLVDDAQRVLQESAAEGEPVVAIALSIEGIRRLDDEGQWELRNWLLQQVGLSIRRKLRSDDLVGRFSDDRFVAILRRLDISLGRLIAKKLLEVVSAILNCDRAGHAGLRARCGLTAGEGSDLDVTLAKAFEALHQARLRRQDLTIADCESPIVGSAVAGSGPAAPAASCQPTSPATANPATSTGEGTAALPQNLKASNHNPPSPKEVAP